MEIHDLGCQCCRKVLVLLALRKLQTGKRAGRSFSDRLVVVNGAVRRLPDRVPVVSIAFL